MATFGVAPNARGHLNAAISSTSSFEVKTDLLYAIARCAGSRARTLFP